MAGVPIADSMKVTVLLLQNVTGESMQFGFHTGKREDEDSLHDIHNAAVDFANGLSGDGIICGMSIVGTSEAYWLTGGGFAGAHHTPHEDESTALSTAAQLPPWRPTGTRARSQCRADASGTGCTSDCCGRTSWRTTGRSSRETPPQCAPR